MYEVHKLDLSLQRLNDFEVSQPNRRVTEFFVLDIPAGASFKLRIGNNPDLITISRAFTMEPEGDIESNNGLYIQNPVAQAGVTVELIIVYGSSGTSQLNAILK